MKDIIKRVLTETIEDKKLQMAYVYLGNYMNTLEEVVKDNGDILLRDSGDGFFKVLIEKKPSKCWVIYSFWKEFSELFSLQRNEIKSLITIWVENTYQLKDIYTFVVVLSTFDRILKRRKY